MENTNVFAALRTIALCAEHTAPVKLKVGYTDKTNFVHNDEIVLIDCPPSTIEALRKEGFVFRMSEIAGGLVLEDIDILCNNRIKQNLEVQ